MAPKRKAAAAEAEVPAAKVSKATSAVRVTVEACKS
jgi:hypothetical protein